ncbi:MAG: hypothetical protein ACRDLY_15195 [Thermoleophilaceae bacterium]
MLDRSVGRGQHSSQAGIVFIGRCEPSERTTLEQLDGLGFDLGEFDAPGKDPANSLHRRVESGDPDLGRQERPYLSIALELEVVIVDGHDEAAVEFLGEHSDDPREEGVGDRGEVCAPDPQPGVRVVDHEERVAVVGAEDRDHVRQLGYDVARAEALLDLLPAALQFRSQSGVQDLTWRPEASAHPSFAATTASDVCHSRFERVALSPCQRLGARVADHRANHMLGERARLGDGLLTRCGHGDPKREGVLGQILDERSEH